MRYKIGVYGSFEDFEDTIIEKAIALGAALAKKRVIIITGASPGIPYLVAKEAAKGKTEIWGYSPELDFNRQKLETPKDDLSIYTKLFYIPKDSPFVKDKRVCRKYRNVISTANCDCAIIISGRWGTMNEFTNLYDMGKVIGVLTETGGIADELPILLKKIHKKSSAKVFFNSDPVKLIAKILIALKMKTSVANI